MPLGFLGGAPSFAAAAGVGAGVADQGYLAIQVQQSHVGVPSGPAGRLPPPPSPIPSPHLALECNQIAPSVPPRQSQPGDENEIIYISDLGLIFKLGHPPLHTGLGQ